MSDEKTTDELMATLAEKITELEVEASCLNDIRGTIAVNVNHKLIPAEILEPDGVEGKVFKALTMLHDALDQNAKLRRAIEAMAGKRIVVSRQLHGEYMARNGKGNGLAQNRATAADAALAGQAAIEAKDG